MATDQTATFLQKVALNNESNSKYRLFKLEPPIITPAEIAHMKWSAGNDVEVYVIEVRKPMAAVPDELKAVPSVIIINIPERKTYQCDCGRDIGGKSAPKVLGNSNRRRGSMLRATQRCAFGGHQAFWGEDGR